MEGHHPILKSEVPKFERKNNKSYFQNEEFAIDAVFQLIKKGKVEVIDHKPHVVNPLSVAIQRNKNRLILDCPYLNQFIEVPHFKYEDAVEALNYFKKDSFLFKWDLKDGYHQVLINKDFKTYLGFKINVKGKDIYCQYKVGPFGLRHLPYLYTKILKVLVRHWRSLGLAAIKFLDDGICICETKELAIWASDHIRKDLLSAGAFWSVKKSQWDPMQVCEWLGLIWDAKTFSIKAAPHRVKKIKETAQALLSNSSCHVRQLASFVGQINSMSIVTGNCSSLTTRRSQIAIAAAKSWDQFVSISCIMKEEIEFWGSNIDILNIKTCGSIAPPVCLNVIATDASDSGCGAIIKGRDIRTAILLSKEQSLRHSTFHELIAVKRALESFLPKIKYSTVKLLVDNQSAVRIIDVGSMKADLHEIAIGIFFTCLKNGISLITEWVPREFNQEADAASREAAQVDTDDWQLTSSFFRLINQRWGPITIDCFANHYNAKAPRFYSMFLTPGCEGVNAFSFDWKNEVCLLVPPVCLPGRTLRHLELCKGKGIIVVPDWPSAHYWPMVLNEFRFFVKDMLRVKGNIVLEHGCNVNSLLGSRGFKGDMLAMLVDCS